MTQAPTQPEATCFIDKFSIEWHADDDGSTRTSERVRVRDRIRRLGVRLRTRKCRAGRAIQAEPGKQDSSESGHTGSAAAGFHRGESRGGVGPRQCPPAPFLPGRASQRTVCHRTPPSLQERGSLAGGTRMSIGPAARARPRCGARAGFGWVSAAFDRLINFDRLVKFSTGFGVGGGLAAGSWAAPESRPAA